MRHFRYTEYGACFGHFFSVILVLSCPAKTAHLFKRCAEFAKSVKTEKKMRRFRAKKMRRFRGKRCAVFGREKGASFASKKMRQIRPRQFGASFWKIQKNQGNASYTNPKKDAPNSPAKTKNRKDALNSGSAKTAHLFLKPRSKRRKKDAPFSGVISTFCIVAKIEKKMRRFRMIFKSTVKISHFPACPKKRDAPFSGVKIFPDFRGANSPHLLTCAVFAKITKKMKLNWRLGNFDPKFIKFPASFSSSLFYFFEKMTAQKDAPNSVSQNRVLRPIKKCEFGAS